MMLRERWLAPLAMLALVAAVYLPPGVWSGRFDLLGFDYLMLHQHRIQFAQEWLRQGTLPGWYPREFCGSPFWANVQNFPFIPSRLILLGLPTGTIFPAGVLLAAQAAALFTYLLARRWKMSPVAAATAGWTFAASGFFASRVAAGHLPMLEVYPALPLLMWLTDRALSLETERRFDPRLLALSAGTAFLALGGHPQLWVYALLVTIAYAIASAGRRALWLTGAMAAGLGMSCFALWPMMLLVARSTRTLDLERAANDIALPYSRLLAAFLPWRDYKPVFDPANNLAEFTQGAVASHFWDTVWYVGLLPWLMLTVLVGAVIVFQHRIGRRAIFMVIAAVVALMLALPISRELFDSSGWTVFRSPARWIYVVVFALSLTAGAGTQVLIDAARHTQRPAAILLLPLLGALLTLHTIDLGLHSRHFVQNNYPPRALPSELDRLVRQRAQGARVAIDLTTRLAINRSLDDVSAFDSIMLARSYQAFLAHKNAPPQYNNQWLPAFAFDARLLRAWGATMLITSGNRDLPRIARIEDLNTYTIDNALPRAAWVAMSNVEYGTFRSIDQRLRDRTRPLQPPLLVEVDIYQSTETPIGGTYLPLAMDRQSPDVLRIEMDTSEHGMVRIAEAIDPGWAATLNGKPVEIYPAELMFMAVRVPPGKQVLELRYSTPGWRTGAVLSIAGVAAAVVVSLTSARRPLQAARREKFLQ